MKNQLKTAVLSMIPTALALSVGVNGFSTQEAFAAGACRYMTIERGRKVEKCEENIGHESVCKRKSPTGGKYKYCPNQTCANCQFTSYYDSSRGQKKYYDSDGGTNSDTYDDRKPKSYRNYKYKKYGY